MLIIRKITHRKNSLKRKLQLSFEALSLCNLMIVKGVDGSRTQNIKTCKRYSLHANTTHAIVRSPFDKSNFARVDKTQNQP